MFEAVYDELFLEEEPMVARGRTKLEAVLALNMKLIDRCIENGVDTSDDPPLQILASAEDDRDSIRCGMCVVGHVEKVD